MMTPEDTPKYEHAYRVIVARLKAGRYPIGGRMPTESELANHFDVSRVTIRRALNMLVTDGYLECKQGSGYTILTLSPAADTCLTSFTDAMLRAGREPTSRFLSLDRFESDARETAHLPGDMPALKITRVKRLRLVDETPRMVVMTYAPSTNLKNACAEDFPESGSGQSILRILSARFQLEWSAACEDISPVLTDEAMAAILNIAAGTPLLRQTCSAFNDAGQVVFHEEVFRMGSVSFNLKRQARTPLHH